MGLNGIEIFQFGVLPKGKRNLITDVPGVMVGHVTITNKDINTGVTAILPHGGNCFLSKVVAGVHIINGFGKSVGLIQLAEMGNIETPIILTNTFSVGTAFTALVKYMIRDNADIGRTTTTVNPMVLECNDGELNDIQGMHVKEKHIYEAINNAGMDFAEGAVGAGRGMCCYGLKGGIGSSSRQLIIGEDEFHVGTLVLTNFGRIEDLRLCGNDIGRRISYSSLAQSIEPRDKGSVIIVIATDIPMSSRQLCRLARRAQSGLARSGSFVGNGSGEIAICFSTANKISHYPSGTFTVQSILNEDQIDLVFKAACESVDESVISSMYHAEALRGMGNQKETLKFYLDIDSVCKPKHELLRKK